MLKGTFEINQKVIEIKEIFERISNVIYIEKFIENKNLFEALMEACKYCSLGEITHALFMVGGQYRRNM